MGFLDKLVPQPDVAALKAKNDVTGLVAALGYQKDAATREAAALALGETADVRAMDALSLASQKDKEVRVRASATEALESLRRELAGSTVLVHDDQRVAPIRVDGQRIRFFGKGILPPMQEASHHGPVDVPIRNILGALAQKRTLGEQVLFFLRSETEGKIEFFTLQPRLSKYKVLAAEEIQPHLSERYPARGTLRGSAEILATIVELHLTPRSAGPVSLPEPPVINFFAGNLHPDGYYLRSDGRTIIFRCSLRAFMAGTEVLHIPFGRLRYISSEERFGFGSNLDELRLLIGLESGEKHEFSLFPQSWGDSISPQTNPQETLQAVLLFFRYAASLFHKDRLTEDTLTGWEPSFEAVRGATSGVFVPAALLP